MFEFFFKYSRTVYNQGSFVFLNAWPVWMLWAGIALAAAGFGFLIWRKGGAASGGARDLSRAPGEDGWLLPADGHRHAA